ncbi:MAG: hypothetical protein QW578_06385 [Thermoplasmatales archaeon]
MIKGRVIIDDGEKKVVINNSINYQYISSVLFNMLQNNKGSSTNGNWFLINGETTVTATLSVSGNTITLTGTYSGSTIQVLSIQLYTTIYGFSGNFSSVSTNLTFTSGNSYTITWEIEIVDNVGLVTALLTSGIQGTYSSSSISSNPSGTIQLLQLGGYLTVLDTVSNSGSSSESVQPTLTFTVTVGSSSTNYTYTFSQTVTIPPALPFSFSLTIEV